MTPVFLVDQIEPCLDFWVDRLGFHIALQTTNEDGAAPHFVILKRDDCEIIYQTRSSIDPALPGLAAGDHSPWIVNYIQVASLADLVDKFDSAEIVAGPRRTFYGTDEIFVREPSGRVIAFAAQGRPDAIVEGEAA
jgi:catechol 2,3-dioxygenase-like lactoylglutathione lyase family enzyme